jgi:hypothetical protein
MEEELRGESGYISETEGEKEKKGRRIEGEN